MFIRIVMDITVRSSIAIAGIVFNVLNMVIFSTLGLKDSMSVGLFSLSFTDFLITCFQLASSVCYIVDLLYPTSPIDAVAVGYFVFGFLINTTYLLSCWITAMISVERCVCVASPFKVKQIFTRHRSIISVLITFIAYILLNGLVYSIYKMEWQHYNGSTTEYNFTETPPAYILTVRIRKEAEYLEIIFDISVRTCSPFLSQAIVLVCAVWIRYSLNASSKIRRHISDLPSGVVQQRQTSVDSKSSSRLSRRERKLVKVVLYLGIILTVCNLPRAISTAVCHTLPGMDPGIKDNLNTTLWVTVSAIGSVGCTVNSFVYFSLNKKYKKQCCQIFRLPCK
ncbi:hypothetical protein BsWGS_28370 [Bradybaena similaris]